MDLFSEDNRRNPFTAYDQMRHRTPVCSVPQFDLWMLLDYEGVKRALVDHDTFSSDLSYAPAMHAWEPHWHAWRRGSP